MFRWPLWVDDDDGNDDDGDGTWVWVDPTGVTWTEYADGLWYPDNGADPIGTFTRLPGWDDNCDEGPPGETTTSSTTTYISLGSKFHIFETSFTTEPLKFIPLNGLISRASRLLCFAII